MACTEDFIDFICSQIAEAGCVSRRKMFGDWLIYVNGKPVVLACDDVAYVKTHPAIAHLMGGAERGCPYEGAREHYVLDVGHKSHALEVVSVLEKVLPLPKSRAKKK